MLFLRTARSPFGARSPPLIGQFSVEMLAEMEYGKALTSRSTEGRRLLSALAKMAVESVL
jgi:hypothetical protein